MAASSAPPPQRPDPPDGPGGGRSRLPSVLVVVLLILAVAGAIVLFTVIKPNPSGSATGVAKALLKDYRAGKDVDKWRCKQERKTRPHNTWVNRELGVAANAITGYSVQDKGKVQRISDNKKGTAVEVTVRTAKGSTSVDMFVVREDGDQRVCGIGSLTPGVGG